MQENIETVEMQKKEESTTKKRKKSSLKIGAIIGISVILLMLLFYLAVSCYFMERYYFHTYVGDLDCGGQTVAQIKEKVAQRIEGYTLIIVGREGAQEQIRAAEIGLEYVFDDTLDEILQAQNPFYWPVSLWENFTYEIPDMVDFEEELLQKRLNEMPIFQQKNMRKPTNAYIRGYSGTQKAYVLMSADKGTKLKIKEAKDTIREAIVHLEKELTLEDEGCYIKPEIDDDDKDLQRILKLLNQYVSAEIIYDWNGTQVTVDGDIIATWLTWDEKRIYLDEEEVFRFIRDRSRENDTYGQEHLFGTSTGRIVRLKGNAFGWKTNREKELKELLRIVRAGVRTKREPVYMYEGAAKGKNDIGSSYVEIDLGNQHLYLYVEGQRILESDFVSGNMSRGFGTPAGVFGLTYKTLDAVLRGPGYETPVKYWMPFNGNIGMHDAGWRSRFGGDIYLTNGSHGCINLPREIAEEIYEYVHTGFPVVCYY